jgi:hypothetical protein
MLILTQPLKQSQQLHGKEAIKEGTRHHSSGVPLSINRLLTQ